MIKDLHHFIQKTLIQILDWFYPWFKRWMPIQTFRYAASGGGTQLLNILIYYISYNFILKKEIVHLPLIAISPHIAAFLMAFCVSFPLGFYLNYALVFHGSYLKKRTQLTRYFMVVLVCILLNYLFMKLFVEQFLWYPTISFIITNAIVIVFSYFSQRQFTFRQRIRL